MKYPPLRKKKHPWRWFRTDIELLSGYDSLSSFVGTVTEPIQPSSLGESSMVFNSKNGKQNMVAVLSGTTNPKTLLMLESVGFESIPRMERVPSRQALRSRVVNTI